MSHPSPRDHRPALDSQAAPEHKARHWMRAPFTMASFWVLPMVAIMAVAVIGTALYLGGLSTPEKHFHQFPIALVNQDEGAQFPQGNGKSTHENLGEQVAEKFQARANEDDQVDLRRLDWEEAQHQLDRGQVYAAVVIPTSFSKDTAGLVSGALTQQKTRQPEITVYTDPQAGSIGTKLAMGAVEPGLEEASRELGKELTAKIGPAEQQAQQKVLDQLKAAQQQQGQQMAQQAAQGGPAVQRFAQQVQKAQEESTQQIAENLSPTVSSVARETLAEPVRVTTEPYEELEEGTALGMGAFYYSILLLVVGFSGSVALNVLMDGRMGMGPFEMGPFFRDNPRRLLPRGISYLIKWGTFTVAAAPASALMIWVASSVGMPVPNGLLLYFVGWLAMSAISAIVLALIALGGSVGMLLSLIYLVFMGLPSAGAVVPLQALPSILRAIAPFEPLHHVTMAVRAVLYFDALPDAGLQSGLIGLAVMLVIALVVGILGGLAYDKKFGLRGATEAPKHVADPSNHVAESKGSPLPATRS